MAYDEIFNINIHANINGDDNEILYERREVNDVFIYTMYDVKHMTEINVRVICTLRRDMYE